MSKRIGVLTSGGDCPGLNAVIRGVVKAANKLSWEVVGFMDGFEGLLPPGNHIVLNDANTSQILQLGGTILGTTNKGHFVAKKGAAGERALVPEEIVREAHLVIKDLKIDALIVIGGDGSLTTALQLFEEGWPVVGVPKTIDNDLDATAMTFGFDSAVACVSDALDRLHTTAASHKRAIVIEVMGRHAGWIALYGGITGGADAILIPEIPFDYEKVSDHIRHRDKSGYLSSLIVVAEGAKPKDGQAIMRATDSGEYRMGGIGDIVAEEIAARTGKETRSVVLGHLQRGGKPTTLDRILGTRFGVHAINLIRGRQFGRMVSYQNYQTQDVPIAEAVHKLRLVPPDGQIVATARAVDISFGD